MPLEYLKAKNESDTVNYNGLFLHSVYNPEKEAERFVSQIELDFNPEYFFVFEPALSYCLEFLKKRFPSSKFCAVRFEKDFLNKGLWDKELFFSDKDCFSNYLFLNFLETDLLNSFFVSWPPSSKAFEQKDKDAWDVIKATLKLNQSVLATRQYFAFRWITNSVKYFSSLKKTAEVKPFTNPVLICASGLSLKKSIPFIKKFRERFFLLACSSGILPLIKNDIIPDLCITTDGGFWAKKHLECLLSLKKDIPVAVPCEANLPSGLFSKNTIIPLAYRDNFDDKLFEKLKIPFMACMRNGTISGTAVDFALSITTGPVFFTGLDLKSSKGFVHTQPNELEKINSAKDNFLLNKETRIFISGRDSSSLETYRKWFSDYSEKIYKRVYRLSDNYCFNNTLGKIKDINWTDFEKLTENTFSNTSYFSETKINSIDKIEIKKWFCDLLKKTEYVENYFPADTIMIKRTQNDQKAKYENMLLEKIKKIKILSD